MFTTLSTIFVPIKTGLTSSPPLWLYPLLLDSVVLPVLRGPLFGARVLAGEHDFCLGFVLEEDERAAGALGLPLDAEAGLLGKDAFRL